MDNFKIIAIYIMRGFMSIFSVFPIKEKRYFFCSYDGKSISCNPLYFNRYLIKKNEEAEYIWAVNDIDNVFIPEDIRGKIKIVKTGSFHYFYYLTFLLNDNIFVKYYNIYLLPSSQLGVDNVAQFFSNIANSY